MSIANDLLADAFTRVSDSVHGVADGLSLDQLAWRVDGRVNSIGWLLWHLTRVEDDHIAAAADHEQVWQREGWAERFGLPIDATATGYGQTSEEVAAVRPESPELVTGYFHAVHERTIAYVDGLGDEDLVAVVDDSFDPPVTLSMRLVSVVNDITQHAGQAAFVRGLLP